MKKKVISLVLSSLLALGALAGCGSSSDTAEVAGAQRAEETTEQTADGAQEAADNAEAAGEVTVIHAATSGNPRPFTYIDEEGNLVGQNIELIKAVFDKLPQYELEIEVTEFPSIFTGIDAGIYDLGVNNIAKNPDREAKYLFTDPEMVNHYIAVVNKNIDITSIEDLTELAGTKYVGTAGNDKTTVVEKYNEEHPDKQITIDYTEAELLSQLYDVESGKEDFLIIDAPMYNGYYGPEFKFDVNTFDLTNVKSSSYSYFIVGKDNTKLAEDINAALKQVIEEGISTEIDIKYLGEDYSPIITE
ncbi:transporter substrate-binding domain-containing protein [Butyrivibrio sp. VCB2001]|uniref:transporter substrate-binding domain-containing protein n=1 Tax=Butyrivibrio sp. VCB2001 TaxID=1280667 RepID=UPI000412B1BF|nr:transporter substrate-binding domain-containing protein [Butyrivibrio sp. VCB2001]